MEFTALKNFSSPELHSDYVAGLSYSARAGDRKLRELLPQWVKDGKVQLGRNGATVKGN
jgi:hypothetical protein